MSVARDGRLIGLEGRLTLGSLAWAPGRQSPNAPRRRSCSTGRPLAGRHGQELSRAFLPMG